MKKLSSILLFFTVLYSPLSFSQTIPKSIKVTANVKPGCNFSGENFDYGQITNKDVIQYLSLTRNLTVRCSKNTTVSLSQSGIFLPTRSGEHTNTLSHNGLRVSGYFMPYVVYTDLVSNSYLSVTQLPFIGTLGYASKYHLIFKTLTSEEFNIPLTTKVYNMYNYQLITGDFKDTITYTLSF